MDQTTGAVITGIRGRLISQIGVAICVAINMLDGFDVLAISWAAPDVAKHWSLGPAQTGLLLSAGLAGMTLGSLFLSPIADIFGRRVVLLTCLSIIAAAMIGSAFAPDWTILMTLRFVTGLGIGGVLAGINTTAAEYVGDRERDVAIAFVTAGYPIGASLGGIVAIGLIGRYGWPYIFLFGGIMTLVLIPIVWLMLPESLAFLLERRPRNALARTNAVLARLGRPSLAALPERTGTTKTSLLDIFGPELRIGSAYICAAFFMTMMTFYFVLSWLPKVLVDMGLSTDTGITASILANTFGIVGGIVCGFIARQIGLARTALLQMTMTFVLIVVFALLPVAATPLLATAAVLGFFMFGMMTVLYATVARVFPTHVRATGTGLAIGVGRVGATLGPYIGGLLIMQGWDRSLYWTVLGLPVLAAAVLAAQAVKRARPVSPLD